MATTASSDPLRMKKRRRSSHLHHHTMTMVCCALNETTAKNEDHDIKSTSLLQEGENWLVCSFSHTQPPFSCIVDGSLNKIMGATTGRPFPLNKALDIGSSKPFNDTQAPSKEDDDRMGFALLCIDIDGEYVALKDVRQKQMQATNKELKAAADNIELFICRKRNKSQTSAKKADEVNVDEKHLDGQKNYSSDESTSGCGTDEVEELTEACSSARRPPPKRETDQDDNGRFLYGYPEPLPRRQLRVLEHGDRILLRYSSETGVSLMKFEYAYGHQDHLFLEQREAGKVNHASVLDVQPQPLLNKTTKADGSNMNDYEEHITRKDRDDYDDNDDDDEVVEKDSCISRVVAIKDPDHVPAITGIEVANVALEQKEVGDAQDAKVSEGKDVPSTSAVVAGGAHYTETSDDNVGTGVLFEEDGVKQTEHEESQTAPFFTAPDHEDESIDDELSGEELLSPVKSPSKEDESVRHAVQFDSDVLVTAAAGSAVADKDGEDGDDSVTDYSLTQPYPVPRFASEQRRSSSSSSTGEDDDESTVCPEAESLQPEPEDSKLPPIDSKEDEEEVDVYNEPTQPFQYAPKSTESCNQSEDDYQAETQFEMITSSKKESNRRDENEANTISVIDNHDNLGIINQEIAEEPEPAEKHLTAEENKSEAPEMGRDATTSEDLDDNTKRSSTNDSEHEKHCDGNELGRSKNSEAAIPGPVREIVANIDTASAAPKSDDTEETVCQIDDANGVSNEVDGPDHAPAGRKRRESHNTDPPAEISVSVTPRQRASRKRGTPTSARHKDSKEAVRVMFTGLAPTKKHKQMISDIGAVLIDSIDEAKTATHIIATDGKTTLRRTPKLMICFCKTSNILSIEWLEQSAKVQKVLDTDDFLLLSDKEAEKTYNFSLSDSLRNGALVREERGGVLGGWNLYICSGVAGNRAPPAKELKLIVEAAGATFLRSVSGKSALDPAKTIIITSDPANDKQLKEARKVTTMGARTHTTTWLFQVMITQSLVEEGKCSKKRKMVSPPSSGKRKSTRRK